MKKGGREGRREEGRKEGRKERVRCVYKVCPKSMLLYFFLR
jgi:hypothetical protein